MTNKKTFNYKRNLPQALSKKEIKELFKEKNNGSSNARETLIYRGIGIVTYTVDTKFPNVSYDKQELISIGIIGLIKAVDTYNISCEYEFITYATACIKNEILMFLRNSKKHNIVDSFNKTFLKNDKEIKLEDTLYDPCNMVLEYEEKETKNTLNQIIEKLPFKEKEIIKMYFGFYNDYQYSQKEIGEKFGFSQSYASEVINKTLKKIKFELESLDNINVCKKRK